MELRKRIAELEQRSSCGYRRAYRMLVGETTAEALKRLGLPPGADVILIRRVIVDVEGEHHGSKH
jgi:hypothetical protein